MSTNVSERLEQQTDQATWFAGSAATGGPAPVEGINYLDAIRRALETALGRDDRVVLLGEDIGAMGGAFRATEGLYERFGAERVVDTPLAETALVGAAIGLAVRGLRPVVEMQFADFVSCAYDQLVNEAAKLHYRFGISVPLVVRCPSGGGLGAGPFHSQSPEGVFSRIPGLKIFCPGTVQDAHDLLLAAIEDPDPVLFFEHKRLYRAERGPLDGSGPNPRLGSVLRRAGRDATIVTYGGCVPLALAAADRLAAGGVECEVVDLRTLVPLDLDPVVSSLDLTGRLVIVHEDARTAGIGNEIVARLAETDALYLLDGPVQRVTAPDTPVPFAEPLEAAFVPSVDRMVADVRRALTR